MKINQVEQLAGITKGNIRFYEKEGLLTPGRNSENGYREYTEADVIWLNKDPPAAYAGCTHRGDLKAEIRPVDPV